MARVQPLAGGKANVGCQAHHHGVKAAGSQLRTVSWWVEDRQLLASGRSLAGRQPLDG
jgi:hypothetical protein